MTQRRFPPPWTVEQIPGGYKVKDANGQSLAYVYGRETRADADIAKVLTMDEARRIASNIAKMLYRHGGGKRRVFCSGMTPPEGLGNCQGYFPKGSPGSE